MILICPLSRYYMCKNAEKKPVLKRVLLRKSRFMRYMTINDPCAPLHP